MTRQSWYTLLQLLLILFISAILLSTVGVLTTRGKVNTMNSNYNFSLESISGGQPVLNSEPGQTAPGQTEQIHRIHHLGDGSTVYEMSGKTWFTEMRLLLRLNERGTFQEYRIMYIDNPLQGWEFGNSFAYYELSTIENSTPRTEIWKRQIRELIAIAEDHHP